MSAAGLRALTVLSLAAVGSCNVDVLVASQDPVVDAGQPAVCPFGARQLLWIHAVTVPPDGCLPEVLSPGPIGRSTGGQVTVRCVLQETSTTLALTDWCTDAHGRQPQGTLCTVSQVAVVPGRQPPLSTHGFYYDQHPSQPGCSGRLTYTPGDAPPPGVTATLHCLEVTHATADGSPTCGSAPTGSACTPVQPTPQPCAPGASGGCFRRDTVYLETGSPTCQSGTCMVYRYDQAGGSVTDHAQRVQCSCRCGVPQGLQASVDPSTLCVCPTGQTCIQDVVGEPFDPSLQGAYCVNAVTAASGP